MGATTHPLMLEVAAAAAVPSFAEAQEQLEFDAVYQALFSFVWRSARRLGVGESALDDVVQEVFVVVHRRLATFEGRSSLKTWVFGITLRVVRDHKRSRRQASTAGSVDPDVLGSQGLGPAECAERAEAVRVLHAILDGMDDERREVFVMAELEQLTMPEIADTLAINLNTAYARLRTARMEFEEALARRRARDGWRQR